MIIDQLFTPGASPKEEGEVQESSAYFTIRRRWIIRSVRLFAKWITSCVQDAVQRK
jgi:hypothetical protein